MDDLTDYLEHLNLAEPAAAESVVQAFWRRMAHLVAALELAPGDRIEDTLESLFAAVVETHDRFDPSVDPSILSWFYRQAVPHLPTPPDRTIRKRIARRLPGILAAAPHDLTEPEIANALNLREPVVARRIRDAAGKPTEPVLVPENVDPGAVTAAVLAKLNERQQARRTGRWAFPAGWKEAGLAVLAVGVVLALVFLFLRSDQSARGVDIFEEEDEVLPEPITVASPEVRLAPGGRSPEEEYVVSMYPVLSDDGRFVLFTSNRPDLVPDDTNGGSDAFVRDTETGEIHRVSLGPSGEELNGETLAGGISADGSRVIFVHQQRFDGMEVFLTDWQTGVTRVISEVADEPSYAEYYSPGLSGDGNIAVFWSVSTNPETWSCGPGSEIFPCYDLYVYEAGTETLTQIPFGKTMFDVFQTTSLTFDGSLLGLTLTELDVAFPRLGSPNEQEAVLYDWQRDRFIQLNVAPDGTVGDGPSSYPVMSSDGRQVAFISEAENLVTDDGNGMADVFYLDAEVNSIRRIGFASDDGPSGQNLEVSYLYLGIDISPDGRYVVLPHSAPATEVADTGSIYCSFLGADWDCLSTYLYDADLDDVQQVPVAPILERIVDQVVPNGELLYLPSVSAYAEWIAFMAGTWNESPPCPAAGCLSIWLLAPREGAAVPASSPPAPAVEIEAEKETWALSGSIPGPEGWVNAVAFSPDGRWLAAGRQDGSVQLIDLTGEQEPLIPGVLPDRVSSVSFSPDGRRLAAGCHDDSVTVWDMETRTVETVLRDHPGIVLDLAFSPDGDSLAVGTQQALWIWTDSATGFYQSAGFRQKAVNAVVYSPDGSSLASVSENEVWIRSVESGAVLIRLASHTYRVLDLAVTPATSGSYRLATGSEDGTAQVWWITPDLGVEHVVSLDHESWVSAVAFSPNGGILATGGFDSTLFLWDTNIFELLQALHRSSQDQVLSLAFSPEGDGLAGGTVRSLRVWQSSDADFTMPQTSRFYRFIGLDAYQLSEAYLENWFRETDVELETYGSLAQAHDSAGFDFRTLKPTPDALTFQSAGVYKSPAGDTIAVAQSYVFTSFLGPARLTFFQASRDFEASIDFKLADWPVASSANLFETEIEGREAEIATGGWSYEEIEGERTIRWWSDDASSLFIRWQDDDWYYSVYYDQPINTGMIINEDLRFDLNGLIELIETSWIEW